MSQQVESPSSPKQDRDAASHSDQPLLRIPERNGTAINIPEGVVIPVATYAPPSQQPIPVRRLDEEPISLDIERKPESKGAFSLPHPLEWHHWLIFWSCAGAFVTLTGLVLGPVACMVVVVLSLVGAFVVKSKDDHASQNSAIHVPFTAVSPSQAYKKCPFCAEAIRFEATLCRFCQKDVSGLAATGIAQANTNDEGRSIPPAPKTPDQFMVFFGVIGWLMFFFGVIVALYFFQMDTSVSVPGADLRVHNIGLMQQRQNGLFASVVASVTGLALGIVQRVTSGGK